MVNWLGAGGRGALWVWGGVGQCDGNHRRARCARCTGGGRAECRGQGDGCGWPPQLLRKQSRQKYERHGRAESGCRADGGAGVQRTTGSGRGGGSEELT